MNCSKSCFEKLKDEEISFIQQQCIKPLCNCYVPKLFYPSITAEAEHDHSIKFDSVSTDLPYIFKDEIENPTGLTSLFTPESNDDALV